MQGPARGRSRPVWNRNRPSDRTGAGKLRPPDRLDPGLRAISAPRRAHRQCVCAERVAKRALVAVGRRAHGQTLAHPPADFLPEGEHSLQSEPKNLTASKLRHWIPGSANVRRRPACLLGGWRAYRQHPRPGPQGGTLAQRLALCGLLSLQRQCRCGHYRRRVLHLSEGHLRGTAL